MAPKTVYCPNCGTEIRFDEGTASATDCDGTAVSDDNVFRYCTRCGTKVSRSGHLADGPAAGPLHTGPCSIKVKISSSPKNREPIVISLLYGRTAVIQPGMYIIWDFTCDGRPVDLAVRYSSKDDLNTVKIVPKPNVDIEIEYIRTFAVKGFTIHEIKH